MMTMTMMTMIPMPSLPPQSWDVFFRNANAGAPPGAAYQSPLGLTEAPQLSSLVGAQPNVEKLVEDHLAVQSLIRAYQVDTQTRAHSHTHWHKTIQVQQIISTERESKIRLVPIVFVFLKFSLMVFVCYFCFLKLCFIFCYDSCFCGVV